MHFLKTAFPSFVVKAFIEADMRGKSSSDHGCPCHCDLYCLNVTLFHLCMPLFRSMKGKRSYVKLVCDRMRSRPEDALFTIVKDMKGLGNVVCVIIYESEHL